MEINVSDTCKVESTACGVDMTCGGTVVQASVHQYWHHMLSVCKLYICTPHGFLHSLKLKHTHATAVREGADHQAIDSHPSAARQCLAPVQFLVSASAAPV